MESDSASDTEPLVNDKDRVHNNKQDPSDVWADGAPPGVPETYARRWYILAVFSLLCFTQGIVWNTWGPIAASSEAVFGWRDADIALLSNWGPISFVVSTAFFAWLMDVKGLRLASLITALVIAMGTGLRCITSSKPAAIWLIHIGQMLNGLGGPVAMGACPLLSAAWFPVRQRTTATAVVVGVNLLGMAVSFIIGPYLVPDLPGHHIPALNLSSSSNLSCCNRTWAPWLPLSNSSHNVIPRITGDIMRLMYIEFGWAAAIFLAMLIYFPNKPPTPPSVTAAIKRTDFGLGMRQLFKHRKFWVLAMPYAISSGVIACFSSVLDVNLKPLGVTQDTAGWIGFYGSISSTVSGLVIAGFADIFKRRMKMYLVILFSCALAAFTVFTLTAQGFIPISNPILYTTFITGSFCLWGTSPLFYELSCESTYPIAEGLTNSLLTWLANVTGLVFLLILMVPNIGTLWMNWFMLGCILVSIPILAMFRDNYTRLDIDTTPRFRTITINA